MDYGSMLAGETQRYAQILQGYKDREAGIQANIGALGQNQLDQANRYYDQQKAATSQNAIGRGLANTTVRDSLERGVDAQRAIDVGQIQNDIANRRLQYGLQTTGDTLGYAAQGGQALVGYNFQAGAQQLQQQQFAAQSAAQSNNYALQSQQQFAQSQRDLNNYALQMREQDLRYGNR